MNFINSFYTIKSLSKNGVFIFFSSIGLMTLSFLLIPEFKPQSIDKQLYTLNGFATKHNDNPEVSHFIKSIKKNNGYLCLGTSESSPLNGKNYYDFLNNDPEIKGNKISILVGAGRTCGIHIPLLLHHREDLDSLKIIYFINPIYWRSDLNGAKLKYWDRYSNYKMCKEVDLSPEEEKMFFEPVQAYFNELMWINKMVFTVEHIIRKARKRYFQDLRYFLNPEEYEKKLRYIPSIKQNLSEDLSVTQVDLEKIDTLWNISKSFKNKDWIRPINDTANYRFEELKSFIDLCQAMDVEISFILGPYNEHFINLYDKKDLELSKNIQEKIKQLLLNEEAEFIDASDISTVVGAFNDHAHHSQYGAFLIYSKIKQHLNEKENI